MEAIDFSLRTTQQDLADELNRPQDGGWGWDYWWNGFWRFRHIEFRDDQVFLFADELPPGVYEYEYLVRATTPGKFHERPARVWEMYYPENFGQTHGGWMTIHE
jgi:alpha-2-macroglobulin